MADEILDNWLKTFVDSALARDLDGHMALISREVLVFGVPGFDALEYADWYRQCEHEFPLGLLTGLSYSQPIMRSADDRHRLFKTMEQTRTSDGKVNRQALEMLLQQEPDGLWRLKQLRLLPDDEAIHDGLR